MIISNSIFKAFLQCPARALSENYGRMVEDENYAPEWKSKPTKAMAAGSLVDAIVTRGFDADLSDKTIKPQDFFYELKSSYDDGMENAKLLTNKSGGWNADARLAINAANKLLDDEAVQKMRGKATFQARIRFEIADGITWRGDIDMLTMIDGELVVVDLKSPGRTDEGWIITGGNNRRVPWFDAWSYWFQLCGYRYGITRGKNALLDGKQVDKTLFSSSPVRAGILYATREEEPEIGYVPIGNYDDVWYKIVTGKRADGGESNLEIIRSIVMGEIDAPACGKCDFCKAKSKVILPKTYTEKEPDLPLIDDIYGYNDLVW